MSQAYSKAERDIEKWIEAVIGDYVSGASLQEFLKSGDILCQIMNKVQPNSIKSFHEEPTLAFKQASLTSKLRPNTRLSSFQADYSTAAFN